MQFDSLAARMERIERQRRFPGRAFAAAFALLGMAALSQPTSAQGHPLDNLPAGHWYAVPNSRLDSANPCPEIVCPPGRSGHYAVIAAWSGGTYDGVNDRLLVWGGGHGDYAGNEIYGFDIETMAWSIVAQPSSDFGGDINGYYYSDGKPRSFHTHTYIEYVPPTNSFVSFGAVGQYPNGNSSRLTFRYDFDTDRWENDVPDVPAGGSPGGSNAIYDVSENAVWVLYAQRADSRLHRYDVPSNRFTSHSTYSGPPLYTVAALDSDRRMIVTVGMGTIMAWDLDNPNAPPISPQTSGDRTVQNANAPGFQYDPTIRKFVGWDGGADIFTLDPDTWEWNRIPAAPDNDVVPTDPSRWGTYGRFRYMPEWNAYVLVNDTRQSVYFYKLSDQEVLQSEPPEQLQ